MSEVESRHQKYPLLYVYGANLTFIEDDDAIGATADERIRSIWPLMATKATAFVRTLKYRERANYDPEDVIGELYVCLRQKDDQWSPERGKYVTFAAVLIDRELCAIRDRAKTVHAPRNSSHRLKQYCADQEAGRLTDKKMKTRGDISRTWDGMKGLLDPADHNPSDGAAEVADSEAHCPVRKAIRREIEIHSKAALIGAIRRLSAFEALVLSRLAGLSEAPDSTWLLSWKMCRDIAEIRRAKERAVAKIRRHLASMPPLEFFAD